VNRISRSFTGAPDEVVPSTRVPDPVFNQVSSDSSLGSAWSGPESAKMEQIIREEVQMAAREIIEKVAWEVIPELAESLIKKELEKVLKQIES
jgi:hypothetical protein